MGQASGYAAGVVHYGSDPSLADCLAALRAQTRPPAHVVVVDHDPPDRPDPRRESLQRAHPDVEWIHAANGGYAAGANRVVDVALARVPDAFAVLVLNPDVTLEPGFADSLLIAMDAAPDVALASGKLLRPGGERIDSAGIVRSRSRRFRDRGSEEPDDGRYGEVESVFAVSGAALCVRRTAIPSLRLEGELFDEDFFTYHEDTDLAWRARQLGWRCLYVPEARATHVRGWRRDGRARVPARIRQHSFKNRYLELIKNESLPAFLLDLPFILPFEVARFGLACTTDRALLPAYREAFGLARRALRKRAILRHRLSRMAGANRT